MTETQGTDINETINVKGIEFSAQLNVGATKWLERTSGMSITKFAQDLTGMDGDDFNVTKVSHLLTALYLARHPGNDPQEAEKQIDTLNFSDMMEVLGRARPWEFSPKNSPSPAPEPTPEPSTGPPSSTT